MKNRFKPEDLKNSPKLYKKLKALFDEPDKLSWVDIALEMMKVERRKSNGNNEHG